MLQTNGKVTLSGEIETLATGLIPPFTLSLSPDKIGRLGVWSLSDYPCLRLSPYATHYKQDNDEAVQIYQSMGPEFYASDLDDCLNLNPEMLSSVKSYTVKGEIYETSHTVLYDALNEGTSGVHNERRPVSSELLYDEVYRPPFYIYTGSFILMIFISRFFLKYQRHPAVEAVFNGLRPGVVGLLAAAALVLMNGENFGTDTYQVVISILLFIGCFIASNRYKVNPILLIVCSGILGYVIY